MTSPAVEFVVVPLDLLDPLGGLAALSMVTSVVPGTVWSELALGFLRLPDFFLRLHPPALRARPQSARRRCHPSPGVLPLPAKSSGELVMPSARALLVLLVLVAPPLSAAEPCECARGVRAALPPALSAPLLAAVTDGCVRAAPQGPYELVAELAKTADGSTLTVRLRAGAREVRAWTTTSPEDGLEGHLEPMVEQLRASRPFSEVLRAFEQRPTRCEVDLQGREAFSHGEEVELLVRPTPEPGPGVRLVVQLARGELVGATAVEKRPKTWAFEAASPLALRYRAPQAEKDLLTVYGSCELRPTAQVPLAKTPPGVKLCAVELPVLQRGGGVGVSGSWKHSWDYTDRYFRHVGSHEVTFDGALPSVVEGPVAYYSGSLSVRWQFESTVEVLAPKPGCPRVYQESSGSGGYQGMSRVSFMEVAKAGGPVAAAQLEAAGVTDFYTFDLGGAVADDLEVPGRQAAGTGKDDCHEMHDIRVPVPYPAISVSQPKTNKPVRFAKRWGSTKKSSSVEVTQGNEPGTAMKPVVSPRPGGLMHHYDVAFDVKVQGKQAM